MALGTYPKMSLAEAAAVHLGGQLVEWDPVPRELQVFLGLGPHLQQLGGTSLTCSRRGCISWMAPAIRKSPRNRIKA
jgi:hypothetical protein